MDWTWLMAIGGLLLSLILGAIGGFSGMGCLSLIGKIVGYLLFFLGIAFYLESTGHDSSSAYSTSMIMTGFVMLAGSFVVHHLPWGEDETVITNIVGYILGIILVIVGFVLV